jgi:transcriptional regulator with GAF, ATPase, and Fis domain/ligand-binding sensor domain-containing protein
MPRRTAAETAAAPSCGAAAVCLLLFLCCPNPAAADDAGSVRFRTVGRADGLSQSSVQAIAQDPDGYVWLGTQEGLNRYDGFEFLVLAHDSDDPGSLADAGIRSLFVDRSGVLWVGTDMGGLSRYDNASRSFTNFLHDPSDPASIASNRVRVVFEDSRGRLWVGTDGSGLDQFDRGTSTFRHLMNEPGNPGSLSDNHVWAIAEDGAGGIWVGAKDGLNRLEPGAASFTRFEHDPGDPASISGDSVRALFADRDGSVWIGTESNGLNRYDAVSATFERFVHDPQDVFSISSDSITAIFEDSSGVLWVGTLEGLNARSPRGHGFEPYVHDPADRHSLPHSAVLSIAEDRGNMLWIGTYDGLGLQDQATRAMLHYRHDSADDDTLSENTVTSFADSGDGRIWVGTFGGGLNLLDPATGHFEHRMHDLDDERSLSSDHVISLHVDRRGILWAGTRASGLNRYDPETGSYTHFRHDPDDPASLSSDAVAAILEDTDGGLWIGSFRGGLDYFDRETATFRRFPAEPDDPSALSSDRIRVLFEESAGLIWIGTQGGGLNRFDRATGEFASYRAQPDRPDGLSSDEILMIQEDARGDLWIGTKGGGLNLWRQADRRQGRPVFRRFSELDGLPSSTIYSGIWDQAGHLWLSTARGLSQLDVTTLGFRNYDVSHGLQGDEFNHAAGFRSADGTLYFGGMNGFNAFDPLAMELARPPPQAVIKAAWILGETSASELPLSPVAPVELEYSQNTVTIEFVALDYVAPERNRYVYRLDGLDDGWIDAGPRRQVTFAKLPAGEYTFRVRAANTAGAWSERDAVFRFAVLPAPWKTWWAYSAYCLLALAVALVAGRSYSRRREQAALLENAEKLELSESRLREAQRIAGLGNWVWNVERNELWWSDEIYRLFRADRQTFGATYEAFLECVHPEDRKDVDRAVRQALRGGQPYSIDHRVVRPDGSQRVVHARAVVTFGSSGEALCMTGTMHDVTERKQAEEEIRRRAEFQALLARLSSELFRADTGNIEGPLSRELQAVGEHYGLGAVSIWRRTDDREAVQVEQRWMRRDHRFARNVVTLAEIPWLTERLEAGETVVVGDIRNTGARGAQDIALFEEQGAKSFLLVPMLIDGRLEGAMLFLTVGERIDWSPATVAEFELIAESIAGALGRARAVTELRRLKEQLQEENLNLRREIRSATGFAGIVGEDGALRACLHAVEKVAPTDVPVLILGETGTGKELVARAVHDMSARRDRPMISVNCPALPADIIESELFGHEAGAFTGAHSRRTGRFELADKGTLFLDEIGELPLELQSKLLRVLQSGEFERLGGTETLRTDVRLVAATNRDLKAEAAAGAFRADLYYRIGSFPVRLPPLRARKADIPLLAEHFVHKHAARFGKNIRAISARMIRSLMEYDWPGNVRELESTIERALISSADADILELTVPVGNGRGFGAPGAKSQAGGGADLATVERTHIIDVLEQTRWRISGEGGAASVLGVPSSTLRSKMKRLGISRHRPH